MKKTTHLLLALLAPWAANAASGEQLAASLLDLSLEQLSSVVVSSVSRRDEPLSGAAASVFVISGEDIRRSGARTIPEALRLAPNLQVARSGATGYAISARGFNQSLSNKLLVLIDGRTVYTPLFAGVFWEAQDVVLEDVERIEVISGPGGTLWGANAVNGVINILTKSAAQTQGTLLSAGAGDERAEAIVRHGGALDGGDGHYRFYAKQFHQQNSWSATGLPLRDGQRNLQFGFRSDWRSGPDGFTLQGDLYRGKGEQPQVLDGANLLGRWKRDLGGGSTLSLQAYYDKTSREQQVLDTWDVEGTYGVRVGGHRILWGASARQYHDRIQNSAALAFFPADKRLGTASVFVHDEFALRPELEASLGLKLEHNSYTGWEHLPSARLGWRPNERDFLWAGWSRAVRSPARLDRDLFLPGVAPFVLAGGPDFQSEISYVYELGYRGQPTPRLSWSVTAFYHDHEKVRTASPLPGGTAVVANDRYGRTRGAEGWGTWRVTDRWRLAAGYTRLDLKLAVRPGGVDLNPVSNIASDPQEWWTLRSSHDLGERWELDVMARGVGGIANRGVPRYTAADARLAWRPKRGVALSLAVSNMFDTQHAEWGPGTAQMRRTVFISTRFDLP